MRNLLTILLSTLSVIGSAQNKIDTVNIAKKQLEEVVVTGQFLPQSVRNSVYKIRTINAERIKMRGATDVINVINNELGIRIAPDNTLGESDVRMMGLGGNRIKVLLDGVPLIDRNADTKQVLSQIDINSIERIEIVDGPMSVIYGTDAMAGVINIITKKGKKNGNNLSVAARVQEETAANSYAPFDGDGIHYENISLNWNNNHWQASGYATRNNFNGYADTTTFPDKEFKPKNQWLGGGSFGYRNNNITTWYRLDYLNEEILAAKAMNATSGISFQQHYITNRYTHQAQLDWQLNKTFKINTVASFQDYKRNTETYLKDYKDGSETIATGEGYWDITTFKTYFLRSTASWFSSNKFSLQSGFEIKQDKGAGDRIDGGNRTITDYSLFFSAEIKPTSTINIRPGVRFMKNSIYDAPPVIPSINTKITVDKNFDLRLSYARGFRAPILRELYFKFHDSNHDIIGNENLKEEYSNSFIASINYQTNKKNTALSSSLSMFYNDYKNFIDYALDPTTNFYKYFNIGKYKTLGATLENSFGYKNITATVGFSYIGYYNQFQEDKSLSGNRTKFSWSPEVNSNINYNISKWKTNVGLYYKFTGSMPTYTTTTTATGDEITLSKLQSFHWADLTASKQLLKYLTLNGGVKNIFNVTRLTTTNGSTGVHSGSNPNYAYGRSYFIGISFQWATNKASK